MSQEEKDLATHVEICAIRYKGIEDRYDSISKRLSKVEDQVIDLKKEMAQGFNDIRMLIEKQNNSRSIQIIATVGTIVAAALGVVGYLLH